MATANFCLTVALVGSPRVPPLVLVMSACHERRPRISSRRWVARLPSRGHEQPRFP